MSAILQDLRYATRSLLRTPLLTVAAVLSLGLGIGANTTVFTWVQAVLLRPVPGAADPDSLRVVIFETREGRPRSWSYPNFRDFSQRSEQLAIIGQDDLPLSIAVNGQAERAFGALVSGNYFRVLGVQPALGRLFTEDDDRAPNGHPVVVLGAAYWQRRFAGDPDIVGRDVTVNGSPMTVVGVAPDTFLGSFLGLSPSAYVPMAMQPAMTGSNRLEARGSGWMQVMARLVPGGTTAQAQAEASTLLAQLASEHPGSFDNWRVRVVRPWQATWGAPTVLAPILGVLSIVVALVLLIACANVANLLLARAVGRRREVAVRLSLGASRSRLVRQLLTESLLLALAAGITGVAMAYWAQGLLMVFAPPTDMPIDFGLRLNGTTLFYATAVSLFTGLVFGLAPAWQTTRPGMIHAIKEEAGRGASGGRASQRFRSTLVISQVAVCVVLLVGATLFVRSLRAAQDIDPGFDPDHLVMASVELVPNGYTAETGRQFHRRLLETVRALPGVEAAALGRQVPLGLPSTSSMGARIEGYTPQQDEEVNIVYNVVGARYFDLMRIPLSAGREFTDDDTPETRKVLIVNQTMAARYWPGREAVGGRVRLGGDDYEVVGVAHDIKYQALNEPSQPHMYLPLSQSFVSTAILHVRSAAPPEQVLGAVREVVRTLDPNLPIFDLRTVEEHMRGAVFAQRMGANLLGAMGVLALLLSAIGLYGVMAYAVSQRTQEMGIRLALGASPRALLAMVLRQGMRLTFAGVAIGLALALAATGVMQSLLPGIGARDPVTFVAVPVVLVTIAVAAAVIPARRAGRVDPVVALRYE